MSAGSKVPPPAPQPTQHGTATSSYTVRDVPYSDYEDAKRKAERELGMDFNKPYRR